MKMWSSHACLVMDSSASQYAMITVPASPSSLLIGICHLGGVVRIAFSNAGFALSAVKSSSWE